jgi:CRP-like cAMP-binding protein
MSRRILRTLAAYGEYRAFAAGEPVVQAGDDADAFYVILRGRVGVTTATECSVLREGDYFGEIGLVGDGTRSATAVAVDDLLALEVPRETFDSVLAREPELARSLLAGLTKRLRSLEQRPWPIAPAAEPGLA